MNLSYAGNGDEHIPSTFRAKPLSRPLTALYNDLFPPGSSRDYIQFLTQSYLNLIDAAGLTKDILTFDRRITYDINSDTYFSIYRNSNPVISNQGFPIFIYGKYLSANSASLFKDTFTISQVDNTSNITVYSASETQYLKDNSKYTTPDLDAQITLTFTNGVSNDVYIGTTGLYFTIGGTNSNFTSSSSKFWTFQVEAPYQLDLLNKYDQIKNSLTGDAIFQVKSIQDTSKYENMWRSHFNELYRLAALIVAFIIKVNEQ